MQHYCRRFRLPLDSRFHRRPPQRFVQNPPRPRFSPAPPLRPHVDVVRIGQPRAMDSTRSCQSRIVSRLPAVGLRMTTVSVTRNVTLYRHSERSEESSDHVQPLAQPNRPDMFRFAQHDNPFKWESTTVRGFDLCFKLGLRNISGCKNCAG